MKTLAISILIAAVAVALVLVDATSAKALSCRGQYKAQYYRSITFTNLGETRCEAAPLDRDYGSGAIGPLSRSDNVSARWTGTFDLEAADYEFYARADDGVRLYVDGSLLIDEWHDQGATDFKRTKALSAGRHQVKVEWYEKTGDAVIKVNWTKVTPQPPPPLPRGVEFGVNLAGAEFGDNALPGTYGQNYIYPNAQELDYYHAKGQDVIRLPFRWERVQPALNGPLSSAEAGRIDAVVQAAEQRNMKVIFDVHNYGRYKTPSGELLMGSAALPNSAFADLWRKLATRYASSGGIYGYGLMNEPHDMGGDGRWPAAAQAAVNAIREVDATHAVFVSGDHWSGAQSWTSTSNANLAINDPAGKLVYEAHSYWDNDHSGDYALGYSGEGLTANAGVEDLSPFVGWCEQHGYKCFIGEFGVPRDDARYMTTLDNALAYMRDHGISGTYWAGGPWWGEYNLTIEPANLSNPVDRPQMDVLERY
jgi:endoglucanase